MTDYTTRKIILKNAAGEYLVPYTDKLERDLSDVSAAGTQAILDRIHADGAVLQYWNENLTPVAYQTIVVHKTGTAAYFYVNKTGVNTSSAPDSDTTNWEMLSFTNAGAANVDLSNLSGNGNDKFVTKDTAQEIPSRKTFTDSYVLIKDKNIADNSVTPDVNTYVGGYVFQENDDSGSGGIYNMMLSTGHNLTRLTARKKVNGVEYTNYLDSVVDGNGVCFSQLSSDPPSNDDSLKIPSTKWFYKAVVPDYSRYALICDQSNYGSKLPYTTPENGFVFLVSDSAGSIAIKINDGNMPPRSSNYNNIFCRVKKGDVITRATSAGNWSLIFVYGR